ncbi:MAG: hypothetical protein U0441_22375 [Polyangiaceae bacterium]
MRNMTFGFGLTALTACLAVVNCQGSIDSESSNPGNPDKPAPIESPNQRGTVISARLGNGMLLPGISGSGNVYVKPQPSSAEGGTGGTGGTTVTAPANDTCTGEVVTLGAGYSVKPHGTLTGAADDYTTWCSDKLSDPGNPDVVYELDVLEDITLSVSILATGFDPALSLRLTSCAEELAGDMCMDIPGGTDAEHLLLSLKGPTGEATQTVYYLIVDSADGNAGDFDLDFEAATPSCGDGVIGGDEECDPGGGIDPEDGCYAPDTMQDQTNVGCKYGKASQAGDNRTVCPGYMLSNVDLPAVEGVPDIQRVGPFYNGSGGLVEANTTTQDLSICGWPATGPENVFQITPNSSGTMHARIGMNSDASDDACLTLGGGFCADFILYAREGACDGGSETQLACADMNLNAGQWEELEITFAATADTPYWIIVDGLDKTYGSGEYYLETWLMP